MGQISHRLKVSPQSRLARSFDGGGSAVVACETYEWRVSRLQCCRGTQGLEGAFPISTLRCPDRTKVGTSVRAAHQTSLLWSSKPCCCGLRAARLMVTEP